MVLHLSLCLGGLQARGGRHFGGSATEALHRAAEKLNFEASEYLVQMRKVFETCKRQADWQALLAELRQTHKAKRRLMEVLGTLSHPGKKTIE